jgi:hypothetical protein
MNKLLVFLPALACAVAAAQPADAPAPVSVQMYSESASIKVDGGADANVQRQKLGLRIDAGDWSFNLALPQVLTSTTLPISGVGAAWNFSSASSLGLNYRIEPNFLPEAPALRTVGLSYGYQFTSGLRLSTNLGRGMSDSAPRWGAGLSVSFTH